jgi:hypothetical protein
MPWAAAAAFVGAVYAADSASDSADKNRDTVNAAADSDRQIAQETLAYYRERDAHSAALQAQANAIAGRVANSQIATMDQQRRISGEYHARNRGVFWPLEDQMVKDAQNYDTPAMREAKAMSAMADVGTQMDAERQAQVRNRTRMGVNPNSGNMDAMSNQLSLASASAKAAAGNNARDQVELQGWARRMDTASLGRGLASAQATAAGTATSAGNSAVNAAYAPVNAASQASSLMGQGLSSYANQMSNANRLSMSGMSNGSPMGALSAQLMGISGTMAGNYFANQGSGNQGANLAFANGVSASGGDGLGAFISQNNW